LSSEAAAIGAFGVALLVVLIATPVAIHVATRIGFYDRPGGYKTHATATPYLGGATLVTGASLAALVFTELDPRLLSLLLGVTMLCAVGTVDDLRTVRPAGRIAVATAAAVLLWLSDAGWSLFGHGGLDLALTIVWVVGLVNAFNLMDNMDGAAATVAAVSALGVAALALRAGDRDLAVLTLGLAGACVGFLRYNLAHPARIFMGDGGSMPIGFILAAAIMALPETSGGGALTLVPAGLLVGLAIFDTILVIVSRSRRRVRIWSGARDHVTHRLLPFLGSARGVAIALASTQALLCGSAIAAVEAGSEGSAALACGSLVVGFLGLWTLETGGPSIRRSPASSGIIPEASVAPRSSRRGLLGGPLIGERVETSGHPAEQVATGRPTTLTDAASAPQVPS
jgi:UDP-GlcNAc:undecaprenyl-phosphate GlcNAc-1-phosphate transferase